MRQASAVAQSLFDAFDMVVGVVVWHGGSLAERQQMLGQVSHTLAADLLHDLAKLAL